MPTGKSYKVWKVTATNKLGFSTKTLLPALGGEGEPILVNLMPSDYK